MKNRILFVLIVAASLSFSYSRVFADELCSMKGYSLFTVNGIFVNEKSARKNKDDLKNQLFPTFKNEPLTVDFLYNPSHLAGLGDLADAINQGLFDQGSDYDLVEILNDASQKVKTQKLLLVAHSQGNFYSNSFYDSVASKEGGVPSQSIGVYSVASPADHVAGGGKYLTSDTDSVIASTVGRFINILPPNVHIPLKKEDGNGHSFSDVYLKYQGSRIVSDIKSSLNKLQNNDEQLPDSPCISPPELTLAHKITGGIFAVADPLSIVTKNVAVGTVETSYRLASSIGNGVLGAVKSVASAFGNIGNKNNASVILATEPEELITEPVFIPPQVAVPKEVTPKLVQNIPDNIAEISGPEISAIETQEAQPTPPVPIILKGSMVPIEPPISNNPVPVVDETLVEDPVVEDPVIDEDPVIEDPIIDNTPPVITVLGNNSEIIIKDSEYIDAGATALDEVDGELMVETTGSVDTSVPGYYTITYTATDTSSNTSTETRTVKVSSYVYIPKYTFGTENGDGNNWQAWHFNGSYVYNWSDTYVNGYLRQQFDVQNFGRGWCSNCLQRGIFNHDPQQGFETTDIVSLSLIDGGSNPQKHNVDTIFNIDTQWDADGYSYSILNGETTYDSGHIDISGVDENMWVGWDGTYNGFTIFPSGSWIGVLLDSIGDLTGGRDMVLQPYPVCDSFCAPSVDTTPPVISALFISPNSGYAKIGDIVTLSIATDSAGYTAQSISINNVAITDFTDNGDGTYTALYTIVSGDGDVAVGEISASVALIDSSGNSNDAYTILNVNTLKIDANVPIVVSAEIISETTANITFSEDLNGQTITNADFNITGHTLTTPDAFEVTPGVVQLTISDTFTAGETPEIIYNTTTSNGVKDLAGNVASGATLILTNNL